MGYFKCGKSKSCRSLSAVRSSGSGKRSTSCSEISNRSIKKSSTVCEISSATSRRTTGPKRRRSSSCSIAVSRFSASSSSTSKSSLRVTRNVCDSSTFIPGNSVSKCAAITSSRGTKFVPAFVAARSSVATPSKSGITDSTLTRRGSDCGTLTRAKYVLSVASFRTTTARLRDRPEMYGNGCEGSTASGVNTGKTRFWKYFDNASCCAESSSFHERKCRPSSWRRGRRSSWNDFT